MLLLHALAVDPEIRQSVPDLAIAGHMLEEKVQRHQAGDAATPLQRLSTKVHLSQKVMSTGNLRSNQGHLSNSFVSV